MLKCILNDFVLKIRGSNYNMQYDKIKSISNNDLLNEFQNECLTNLLIHSYNNVKYYNRIFRHCGLVRNQNVTLSKFNEIPILTKKIIKEKFNNLISKDYKNRGFYYNTSGGSTGEPITIIQDKSYREWANAKNEYYYDKFLNINCSDIKKVVLWGSEKDLFKTRKSIKSYIINWLTNTQFLNSFKMTEKDMGDYISKINRYKPQLIRGYAGSLYELCKYIDINNKNIYSPNILVSQAETLTNEMREKIESVFRTKVFDFYGTREVGGMAGECEKGNMHIFNFFNYVEVLDENNQPVKEGKEGRVVVTNLHNYSMPLIRYEIGDMAVLGPKQCICGNVLPTLKKVSGRIMEQFVREDGITVPSEFFIHIIGVVCNKGSIKRFQVIQEDYNLIRIRVVPEGTLSDSEKREIEQKIKVPMGEQCVIKWEMVDNISPTSSGKYLYTKSFVWD